MFWPFSNDETPPSPSPRANRIIGLFVVIVLAACLLVVAFGMVKTFATKAQPISVPVVAKAAPAVANVPTVQITPAAPVKVYAPSAKAKLKLPEEVQADQNKYVLTASHIAPDAHPHTVTTVIDQQTGAATTYDTTDPLPWLAIDLHGEAGLLYGVKNGYPNVRMEVRQNLLDVKAVKIGIEATADQPTTGPLRADYFIGVGAWYRW